MKCKKVKNCLLQYITHKHYCILLSEIYIKIKNIFTNKLPLNPGTLLWGLCVLVFIYTHKRAHTGRVYMYVLC